MEHLPVFRAPREGDGRMHQSMDEGRMHQSTDAKKIALEGDKVEDTQSRGRTSRLLDRSGPRADSVKSMSTSNTKIFDRIL